MLQNMISNPKAKDYTSYVSLCKIAQTCTNHATRALSFVTCHGCKTLKCKGYFHCLLNLKHFHAFIGLSHVILDIAHEVIVLRSYLHLYLKIHITYSA